MGFLHPWLLAGLAAAGIPVLLHLLARREPPTVTFPAVRYLVDTTREHSRRLQLRHWVLLLLRTLLIALLVLAAAGPTAPLTRLGGHAPAALVLILDNSLSSGAVSGGVPRLDPLRRAAVRVLAAAGAADRLWLLTADGSPLRGDAGSLAAAVNRATVSPRRLDLGAAIATADQVLAGSRLPGTVVLLSDLQRSAMSPADPKVPLVVAAPTTGAPRNAGVSALDPGVQPWSDQGGRVTVRLTGDSANPVPVALRLDGRPLRDLLVAPGAAAAVPVTPGAPGWRVLTADLPADELRLDDRRVAAVRVAPVVRAAWDSSDRYLAAAAGVLSANHRLSRGSEVTLGRLGPGPSVVPPPADPAALGALNRALARRGIGWQFGALVTAPQVSDSGALLGPQRIEQRYRLEPTGQRTGVLVTVGGAPWIVRGQGVVLIGSRLDPAWTDLPLSAAFVPLVDALANRMAGSSVDLVSGSPGEAVPLSDVTSEVRRGDQRWEVQGGAPFRPPETGIYYLMADGDTVGALAVNPDPRESELAPATAKEIGELWRGARLVPLDRIGTEAFGAVARADLRGLLLWAALLAALVEVMMASVVGRKQ